MLTALILLLKQNSAIASTSFASRLSEVSVSRKCAERSPSPANVGENSGTDGLRSALGCEDRRADIYHQELYTAPLVCVIVCLCAGQDGNRRGRDGCLYVYVCMRVNPTSVVV